MTIDRSHPRRFLPRFAVPRFLLLLLLPALPFACRLDAAPAAPESAAADAKLAAFYQAYLDASLREQPLAATQLGDHRFDDQLENPTPEARRGWLDRVRQTLRELPRAIDERSLSPDGRTDFAILRHDLETTLWLADHTRPWEEDPRSYSGYLSDSVYLLLTQSTLPAETNITHAIARLRRIPAVVQTARATLQRPPKTILETAIRQNRGAIGLYERELFELAGNSPQLPALREAAAPVVAALKDYQAFLEGDLMKRADGDWRLGRRRFARKLELVLDAGYSADEVYADAQREYDRVQRELLTTSRQLWGRYFPREAFPPDDVEGRRTAVARVIAAVSKEHGRPEDLVTDARATVDRIKAFIREHDLLRLPEPDRCQVIEMPEFKRGNSLAYLEPAPPLEPATASFYAVSPPLADWGAARVNSFLEEYNQHMLQILTIHEAYPGHYVQLEYSNRSPSLIRRILQSGVFIEGWAVYTEQTMLDQGYGDGDPRLRLMQLKFYLRAVVNALLDHRMHCTGMTDDEAMHLLVHDAYQSESEARLKIIRAKQTSTQLSTYFVGRMAHYRLRQQIQRELGDAFELGRYHEAVIGHGSVPMKYLAPLVRDRLQQPR